MFNKPQRHQFPVLAAEAGSATFARADVLFALEWSAVAPGIGGWDVLLDDERHTRLVSVVPPGADLPSFFICWKGSDVAVTWLAPSGEGKATEMARYTNLRAAVLALCPLDGDQMQAVNESMEILYPRSLRNLGAW
jgi:hypothetical protein